MADQDKAFGERMLRIELEQESAQRRDDEMIRQMRAMQEELATIRDLLTQAKGGWRLLMMVGGMFAGIYTVLIAVVKLWETFSHLRTPLGK